MPKAPKPSSAPRRSECPASSFLDIVGDRWTLLVARDIMLKGRSRYGELAASNEKIPTNILADRLVKLEAAAIITKRPYQTNPPRYAYLPTLAGLDLLDVLAAMAFWSNTHLKGTKPMPPARYAEAKKNWTLKLKA